MKNDELKGEKRISAGLLLIAFFGGMAVLCFFAGNDIGSDIGEFIYNLRH